MNDKQLVEMYFNGDKDATAVALGKYGALCRSIIATVISAVDEVEECINDVFVTVWRHIPPDAPQRFYAYIGRIARNIAIDAYRRKKRDREPQILSELADCIPSSENVQKTVEAKELSAIIEKWLDTLGDDDCAIFVRRYWYGESVKALSKAAGVSENNLGVRLHRLRKALKDYLESEGYSL